MHVLVVFRYKLDIYLYFTYYIMPHQYWNIILKLQIVQK